jgi:hypothetical protein
MNIDCYPISTEYRTSVSKRTEPAARELCDPKITVMIGQKKTPQSKRRLTAP